MKQGKEEEEEKGSGKEGLGLELEEDGSFCWRTGWAVSFMEKILKRWTKKKKIMPIRVFPPPSLGLESKTFCVSIRLV